MGTRGSSEAVGHFHLKPDAATRYGLSVSKNNDQRFDIHYASSAAARYLKDLDTMFGEKTRLKGIETIPVRSVLERKKFSLAAYNAGEGRIATAQHLAEQAGNDPELWGDVERFLEAAHATPDKAEEIRRYLEMVPAYEAEFAEKSLANKALKQKKVSNRKGRCSDGHWRTIDGKPVFICD